MSCADLKEYLNMMRGMDKEHPHFRVLDALGGQIFWMWNRIGCSTGPEGKCRKRRYEAKLRYLMDNYGPKEINNG